MNDVMITMIMAIEKYIVFHDRKKSAIIAKRKRREKGQNARKEGVDWAFALYYYIYPPLFTKKKFKVFIVPND